MYDDTCYTHKNKFRTNIPIIKKLLNESDIHYENIIKHYIKTLRVLLKDHNDIITIIDVQSLRLDDIKHIGFTIKMATMLQDEFNEVTRVIYITNSSPIFKILYDNIKHVILPDVTKKIKIE
jgi:hypothetical protein